jgi:head-tail adaptor
MRDRVIIQTRAITVPSANSVDLTETFSGDQTVWALVETKTGTQIFDGTNIVGVATHDIYIRFIAGVTFQKWLKFKSIYYDILDVQNLEERDEFYLLRCSLRGDDTDAINFSR